MCPDKVNTASWYFSDLLRVVRYFGICTVPIFLAALAKWGQGVESVALVIHRGGGKFDMKVVPCPKKSYMEVKKSDMEVAPFSLIKALSTFLHRPYFHLFLTQLRYGVACFLTPPPLFFYQFSDVETLVFALNQHWFDQTFLHSAFCQLYPHYIRALTW